MKVVIFTLCRKAVIHNGALSITDAFSNLPLRQVPARVHFTLVTRLFFTSSEKGLFSGMLRFIDPSFHQIQESRIQIPVSIFEPDSTGMYIDSIGAFQVTLRAAGEYQFHITRDGHDPLIFPFYVEIKTIAQ